MPDQGPAPAPQPGTEPAPIPDPAQATAVPKLPLYITTMSHSAKYYPPPKKGDPPNPTTPEEADPIQWNGNDIPLYTFSFLGRSPWTQYVPDGEKTGVYGVNIDLATRLIDAQTNLYWKALAEAQQTDPKVIELSETQFGKWCWAYQEPLHADRKRPDQDLFFDLGSVQGAMGYKDASSPGSFHSSGSAVDIHLMYNPYIPTRNGTYISGEPQKYAKDFFTSHPELKNDANAKHELHAKLIWGPALELFDRAYYLCYGTPSDTSANSNRAQIGASYERFKRLSLAVQAYFLYVYERGSSQPKSQAQFESDFGQVVDDPDSLIDPNASFNGQKLRASLAANRSGTLSAIYNQIIQDRSAYTGGCVSGHVTINADYTLTLPTQRQRDPCGGVFNVRREVFMELVVNQKLNWGGCMLGDKSGADTMHFDMNAHWVNGQEVKSAYRK